jgi:hypothetical protein
MWADNIADENNPLKCCPEPVFSAAERQAILEFHRVWNEVCESTPNPLPPLEKLFTNPAWERLRESAERTLLALAERGKLPEDEEVS